MSVLKKEFIDRMAETGGITKKAARQGVDLFFEILMDCMAEGEKVMFTGVGKLNYSLHSNWSEKGYLHIISKGIFIRSEDANRIREMAAAISRGIQNAREIENTNTTDAFIDRNRRLLDKGREGIKRQQNKTYIS